MKKILCFGDSNTWGLNRKSNTEKYQFENRWTKILQKNLSGKYEIIEDGLNSRTMFSNDPYKPGRIGADNFSACLKTNKDVDTIILMIGTNELKHQFNHNAKDIVKMFDKFMELINNYSHKSKAIPNLIISGVPVVDEQRNISERKDNVFLGANKKSIELNSLLKNYCEKKNIIYIDNTDLETQKDGVHLTEESHISLANKLLKLF